MTHIVICDDSPKDIQFLTDILKKYATNASISIHSFSSGIEFVSYLENGGLCHIAFLDIIMPGFNGIELAKSLRTLDYNGYLIFMTSSNDFAAESYQVSAYSYLLKPASLDKIHLLLDNIFQDMQVRDTSSILIQSKKNTQLVPFRDIISVESNGHYLTFHLSCSDLTVYANFSQYEPSLMADSRFVRCHRTNIINMDHVISVQKQEFIMQRNLFVPISKNFSGVKQEYIRHIFKKEVVHK